LPRRPEAVIIIELARAHTAVALGSIDRRCQHRGSKAERGGAHGAGKHRRPRCGAEPRAATEPLVFVIFHNRLLRGLTLNSDSRVGETAGTGGELGPRLFLLDHDRAHRLGLVENLAMQAVDALVRVDLTGLVDRLNGALIGAALAGVSAF